MRTKTILALILGILPLYVVAPTPAVAALPMPNILLDPGDIGTYSGFGNTVNSIGSASVSGNLAGVTLNAANGGHFVFSGSSSYINFASAYQFGDNFTISAWVRQTGTPSQIQGFVANGASGSNANGFKLFWNEYNTNNRKLVAETGNSSSTGSSVTSNGVVASSGWQHIAFVISRTSMTATVYVNGVAQTMGSNSLLNSFSTNQAWRIGSFTDGLYPMNANMGVFKVFNSALSAADVADDFNQYSVRYIAQNPTISVTTPFSILNPADYRTSVTVTITSNAAGKIALRANGKWIPNCRNISITTTATCTFKPSIHNAVSIAASFTPSNPASFNPATVSASPFGVKARSNKR